MTPLIRMVFAAVAVIAVLAGCWKVLLAPKRAEIATVQSQIVQAQARADTANAAVARADQARAGFERDSASLARLVKAVPEDDDVGPLIRQLDAIARANKIDFRSAKLVAGAAPAAPVAPAPPAEGEEGADKKDPTAPDATAAGAPVAAVVAQPPPGAVVGEAGLLTVPFSFTFDGGYTEMQRFLAAIHRLAGTKRGKIRVSGRLITIDGFSLGAGRDGFPKVKALVSATAYLLPEQAPATTAAPAPGAAAITTPAPEAK